MSGKVADIFVGIGGTASQLVDAAGVGIKALQSIGTAAFSLQGTMVAAGAAIAGSQLLQGFVSFVSSGLDAADAQQEFADKLGVSVAGLSELHYAAKLSDTETEALNAGLAKLGVNLANMDDKAGEGLKQLGLGFADLKDLDLTEAFKKIVTELGKVESPAQRAAIAMKLFGKGGMELRGLLAQGGDGLNKLIAEAHELGVVVSDLDGPKVAAAKDAIDRLEASVSGLGMQLAIGLAPHIEAAATLLKDFLVEADFGSVAKETEAWTITLAAVADGLAICVHVGRALWLIFQGISHQILETAASAAEATAALTGFGQETADFLRGMVDESAGNIGDNVNAMMNFEFPHDKVFKAMDDIKAKAEQAGGVGSKAIGSIGEEASEAAKETEKLTKSADDLIASLQQDVKFHGLDANEKKIAMMADKLKGLDGDTSKAEAFQQEATALSNQLKALDGLKKAQEEIAKAEQKRMDDLKQHAEQVKESLLSPVEKAQQEFEKLKEAFGEGLLTEAEFSKATDKIGSDLGKDENGKGKSQFAGATVAGTQAARDLILKNQNPEQDKAVSVARDQLKIQREQLLALKRLADKPIATVQTDYITI